MTGDRALFAACLALALFAALGQESETPALRGRVIDPSDRPVSGATILLKTAGSTVAQRTLSADGGAYLFKEIRLGMDYEITADFNGLTSRVATLRISSADENAPIRFEDVTAPAGIDFTLHNGAAGHTLQPEIMLGGVAAFDYNNDGCTDIFFTNGAALPSLAKTGPEYHDRLYRNNCDGTFTDVTREAGLAGDGYSMGVGTADYDNDGFADIFVTAVNGNRLYRNKGDGTFEDVTVKAGFSRSDSKYGRMWSISAGWFDYDNDGYLDLFVSNYVAWTPRSDAGCNVVGGAAFYCHPRVYKGLPNQLFHNNRDGTFTDVSESSGIRASVGKGMGVAFGDFDGDGLLDIFVANDSVPNFLFHNLGGGKFKETALETGVAYLSHGNAVAGMGADFRDFDDDGLEDIVLDAMYFDTFPLFHNRGKPAYYVDDTASSGLAIGTRNLTGWGMGMYDFDNDGYKDLFFATSHFPGSEPYVHSPAAIPNHVMHNIGSGYFEDVSAIAGPDFQRPALYHGAAFADFDNDGRVDVVVTAVNGQAKLFRNVSPVRSHWIALRLTGTRSNRDGLGASVKLTLPTGAARYNRATTSVGYASSSEPLVRFGLGPYDFASEIQIRWPSGGLQVLRDVKADQIVPVREQ
jgi:enediyne biosynthesis protein E4